MSGFLKKFSQGEYDGFKSETNDTIHPSSKIDTQEEQIEVEQPIEETYEEFLEPLSEETQMVDIEKIPSVIKKPFDEHVFQTSNTKEERLIRDDDRIKKRRITMIISLVIILVICISGFFIYQQANKITVPSFALEKDLNEVEVWAAKNKIELDSTSEFSIKADEGMIISQSKKSGTSVQKGSSFKVVVSKGANPDETVKLPDFTKMKLIEIETWKDKNKANNVTIEKIFNEEVESGKVISVTFKTEGIDGSNYRRKDKLTIIVSKGKEVFEKDIVVPDFKNKSKGEVDTWASEKDVKVEYVEQGHATIMEGNVISQEIAPKTKIAKNDTIKIVVSKGKISYVPDFSGLDETQATIEATKQNVPITTIKYYHNQVSAGQLISQSLPVGTEVKGDTVVLIYSSGKPYIANYDGQDLYVLVQAIREMNAQGANISYEVQEVESEEPKGSIITASAKANFVDIGTKIYVSISKGK
ncbi:PASTA domain-containing protein [Amedibacillus sp. YH-ame10]